LSKEKNFNINNSNLSKEKNNLNINVQPVINKNEFSLFDGNSNKDSLFDKVLNQVKEKNKTKKKKGKGDNSDDNLKIDNNINQNKIVIQAEVPERKVEVSNEKNFSLFNKEISYLERDENYDNRKFENVLKKNNEIKNEDNDFKIISDKKTDKIRENKERVIEKNRDEERLNRIEQNLNQNKSKQEEMELERKRLEKNE